MTTLKEYLELDWELKQVRHDIKKYQVAIFSLSDLKKVTHLSEQTCIELETVLKPLLSDLLLKERVLSNQILDIEFKYKECYNKW